MMLRRAADQIRAQNWPAIAIELVILVVGVFGGIQVSNWNDARRDRDLERAYLERMHEEAASGLNQLVGYAQGYFEPRFALFAEAVDILGDPAGDPAMLTDAQCDVIGNMHDFIAFPFQFPSLAEMESSGRLGLIQDRRLRARLMRYRLTQDQNNALIANLNTQLPVLPNLFPEYFEAVITTAPPGQDLTYRNCATDRMRADRRFRNQFADLASRYNGYFNVVIEREANSVRRIHAALDEALGIDHADAP